MKKVLLSLAILICSANQLSARQLSATEALQRASGNKIMPAAVTSKPVYTASDNETALYYVFANNSGNGYMIVSADDAAAPVLGYTDSGEFDIDKIPENMKAWLAGYESEIAHAISNGATYTATSSTQRSAIAPLMTTKWDQGSPYNNLCPTDSYGKCYTGCVATAVAQIMNYHEWPKTGTGSHSYSYTDINGYSKSLYHNFAEDTYDWDNMLDVYTDNATEEQCNAVATLMYSVGVGSEMSYTSDGSGANSAVALSALVNFFGYDKSATYYKRSYYYSDEWESLIYNNLANVGPVYYDGTNAEGGHAFVCDGYSDGYFHINWGWSGISDGYFRLSALDPYTQGAGGTSSGYNTDQGAILGIRPDQGGEMTPVIYCFGSFGTSSTSVTKSASKYVTFTGGEGFFSMSNATLDGVEFGVKLVSSSGTTSYLGTSNTYDLEPGYGITKIQILSTKFTTNGTYTVTPAFKYNDSWYDIKIGISSTPLTVTVTSTKVSITTPSVDFGLSATNVKLNTPFYLGEQFSIDATLTCTAKEYLGGIMVALYNTSTGVFVTCTDEIFVNVFAGEPLDINIISTFPTTILKAGEYNLAIIDQNKNVISELFPITLKSAPTSTSVSLTELKLTDGNTTSVNQSNFSITASVYCSEGYFNDDLYLLIFPEAGGYNVDYYTSTAFIDAGETSEIVFNCDMTDTGEAGETYFAVVYEMVYDTTTKKYSLSSITSQSQYLVFTLNDAAGIEVVKADEIAAKMYPNPADAIVTIETQNDIKAIDIYAMSGAKVLSIGNVGNNATTVDVSTLPQGNYIVAIQTNDGFTAKQLIKR